MKLVMRMIIVGYLTHISPALAQNSMTNCYRLGVSVQCDTTAQTPIAPAPQINWGAQQFPNTANAFANGYQQGLEMRRQRERMRAEKQREQSDAEQHLRMERDHDERETARHDVMQHLIKGDCLGATNLALAADDLDLATKTKAFCASQAAPRP